MQVSKHDPNNKFFKLNRTNLWGNQYFSKRHSQKPSTSKNTSKFRILHIISNIFSKLEKGWPLLPKKEKQIIFSSRKPNKIEAGRPWYSCLLILCRFWHPGRKFGAYSQILQKKSLLVNKRSEIRICPLPWRRNCSIQHFEILPLHKLDWKPIQSDDSCKYFLKRTSRQSEGEWRKEYFSKLFFYWSVNLVMLIRTKYAEIAGTWK
jgi:hypothetical protein